MALDWYKGLSEEEKNKKRECGTGIFLKKTNNQKKIMEKNTVKTCGWEDKQKRKKTWKNTRKNTDKIDPKICWRK